MDQKKELQNYDVTEDTFEFLFKFNNYINTTL